MSTLPTVLFISLPLACGAFLLLIYAARTYADDARERQARYDLRPQRDRAITPDLPWNLRPEHTSCADGCGLDTDHPCPCRPSVHGRPICGPAQHSE